MTATIDAEQSGQCGVLARLWDRLQPLIWSLLAAGLGQGATLVLTVGLANALNPDQFGRFSIASTTILSLSALAQFGFAFTALNFVARYASGDLERAQRIGQFCIAASAVLGLAIGCALIAFSWPVAATLYDDTSLIPILALAGIGIPAATLTLVQNSVLVGLQRFRQLAANSAVYAIVVLVASFVGLYIGGAPGAACGYVVAVVVRTLHYAWLVHRAFPALRPLRLPERWREIFTDLKGFLLPAALTGLTVTPSVWLANAWLVNSCGLHALGIFASVFIIKTLVVFVPVQIGTVFLPRYVASSETDPVGADRYSQRVILFVFGFSAATAGVVAALAPWLIKGFGSDFAAGVPALRWLMATVVAESVATIGAYQLAGERRMWTSLLAYTLPKDLILVVAAVLVTPHYGAAGLAAAHLVSWSYGAAIILVLLWRSWRHRALLSLDESTVPAAHAVPDGLSSRRRSAKRCKDPERCRAFS